MIVKKIFSVMLVFCFLNLTLAPHYVFAESESEEEKQAKQDAAMGRALIILAGLALLTYILNNPIKSISEETINSQKKSKNRDRLIDFKFNFSGLNMIPDGDSNPSIQSYDEMLAPGLELIVRF